MTTTLGPALGQGAVMNQATSYDAISARRAWAGFERGEGVSTYGSFRVSQRGAGANMSVDVNMDEGAWVRGDAVALQGLYMISPHASTINEVIAAADATNPRVDRVVLEVKDTTHDASGSSLAQTRVITGTPTAGATLDNLTGAAAVPNSAILLADVLVVALDTSISDPEIRDRRPFVASVPPLLTKVDLVAFEPASVLPLDASGDATTNLSGNITATDDLRQSAALFYLPRRIVSATRIRWRYKQENVTALTGNYVLAIYDSSGRKIVDTGSVAFAGATSTSQARSETIAATTFEPGWYYVFFGLDSTSSGSVSAVGVHGPLRAYVAVPNAHLRSATGGVTPPTTLLAMTDVSTLATVATPCVPICALSVG